LFDTGNVIRDLTSPIKVTARQVRSDAVAPIMGHALADSTLSRHQTTA